jgi:ketosteroid isomerase-like protein
MKALLPLALFIASPVVAKPNTVQTEVLLRTADAFDQAQLSKNKVALDRMVADDLVFIDATGKRSGKAEFIAGWTTVGDRYSPVVLKDRVVTWLGRDGAIVSAEAVITGTSGGKGFSSRIRFSDAFRRVGGRWQVVHIQVTRLPLP